MVVPVGATMYTRWNQEAMVRASTGTALFGVFLAVITRGALITQLTALFAFCVIWALYEWFNWFRTRARNQITDVMSLAQVLDDDRADLMNSRIIVAGGIEIVAFAICGAVLSGPGGAVVGFVIAGLDIILTILLKIYPAT
jgi:hypothetical protein